MNQQPDDPPEDYGYDLAHEVPAGPDRRETHRAHPHVGRQKQATADADTDYSSDEAHDL
jgi:hypothetical protein